jgi:integrase/recombinase XerD
MTTLPILAISPLRQRLLDDMAMRRFGRETQHYYIRDVERFATWLGRSGLAPLKWRGICSA